MKPTRPKPMTPAEVTAAFRRMNEIESWLARLAGDEAKDLHNVRRMYQTGGTGARRRAMESERKDLEKRLKHWAKKAAAEWPSKTYETPFGRCGFRLHPPAVKLIKSIAKTFDDALRRVKSAMPGYVRIKEELDREALLRDAELVGKRRLESCGLKVEQREEFWVSTSSRDELEGAIKRLKEARSS